MRVPFPEAAAEWFFCRWIMPGTAFFSGGGRGPRRGKSRQGEPGRIGGKAFPVWKALSGRRGGAFRRSAEAVDARAEGAGHGFFVEKRIRRPLLRDAEAHLTLTGGVERELRVHQRVADETREQPQGHPQGHPVPEFRARNAE